MSEAATSLNLFYDDKAYLQRPRRDDEAVPLNGSNYAAGAVFGLATLAVDLLVKHDPDTPLSGAKVRGLAHTLASMVLNVQTKLSCDLGDNPFSDGLNTRLRSALHSSLGCYPAPLDSTDEKVWRDWVGKVEHRMLSIARVSFSLWASGPNPEGFLAFCE